MPNYPPPKSSMPKKSTKSSLHPHGAPGFSETIEGLKRGLTKLGTHLVGAGAGIVGNLIGPLTNLRKSAREGDEDAEKAYLEALEMLRSSGSSTAETILRDLGEELGEEEGNEESSQDMQEPEAAGIDLEATQALTEAPEEAPAKVKPAPTPENPVRKGKITCLECGAEFKQLTHSHLSTHGMSPQEYKKKHGLAAIKRAGEVRRRVA